jgi:hypothetical protein
VTVLRISVGGTRRRGLAQFTVLLGITAGGEA